MTQTQSAIGMIFIGTFIGGRIQDRRGPRTVAMVGGAIYGFGVQIGADKHYAAAYTTIGIIALVSIVLPVVTRLPRVRKDAAEGQLGAQAART